MEDLVQKQARLIAGLEEVGQMRLEIMSVSDAVYYLAEKILWLGGFRSLMFALVDWKSRAIRVVADFSYSNLMEGHKTPASCLRRHSERIDLIMHLDADPGNPACRCAVTREVVCIVDGEDDALKGCGEGVLDEWRGKAAYFMPLTHENRTEAVVATGSPLEDHDEVLTWIIFMRPFFDVCGTQLYHIRRQDAILRLAARPQREQDVLLTDREKTVLGLIASGLTDAAIADQLHVSKSTVGGDAQKANCAKNGQAHETRNGRLCISDGPHTAGKTRVIPQNYTKRGQEIYKSGMDFGWE